MAQDGQDDHAQGETPARRSQRERRAHLRFDDLAPPDRFCDLILTGGVTSAVAYPGLVGVLATAYRFHAIGGSSSGAGIAALAAAAEYRRRHGSAEGFRTLLEGVSALAETTRGGTRLSQLFQPERRHRLLFELLLGVFENPGREFWALLWGLLRQLVVPWVLIVAAVLLSTRWLLSPWLGPDAGRCLGIATGCTALAAVAGWSIVVGLLVALVELALSLRRVVRDDYGLCSGLSDGDGGPDQPAAITPWLHGLIQQVAGRQAEGEPLTFDDLGRAPGSPRALLGAGGTEAGLGICLQVMSANVTHGRPYRFPLDPAAALPGHDRLYFRPREARRVFPARVVDFMIDVSRADGGRWPADRHEPDEEARWRLPDRHLPLIVAVRMSVSFPLLFKGVRLWAPHVQGAGEALHPCIFMDGGLCANFPIHLFDSAVPSWPTFGVSLHDRAPARGNWGRGGSKGSAAGPGDDPFADRVVLPTDALTGSADWRAGFDELTSSFGRLSGLLLAMLTTVKDWNDSTAARLPGVWDRVVRIELEKGEGGLNIRMIEPKIDFVADLGVEAGHRLIDRFARADCGNGLATGWTEHRWVRLERLRAAMARYLDDLGWSLAPGRHAEAMAAQVRRALDEPPRAGEAALSATQVAELTGLLAALVQAERALGGTPRPSSAGPQPVLRIRAPL